MEKLSKSLSTDFSDQTFLENSDGKPLQHKPDTIRLIKEMYASGLSMARIAGAINMSQSYVSIVINWYFPDVSKRYFLSSMEMKEDIEALLKSGETISSIALILGKKIGTVKQYIYRNIPGYGGTNNVDKRTIDLVGGLYRSGKKYKEISSDLSISEYYVRNIIGQFYQDLRKRSPESSKLRISKIEQMLRDGHSYKDIAQELGISLGNVHSLVFRYFPASRRDPVGGKFVRK